MEEFRCKTRAMTSPQGKPRVYFCCHPADFSTYFEEISGEILQIQNCAVWYPADLQAPRTDERREDLKQMQLFLLPVTNRLLRTENPALEEFRFAVAHRIPVLPLLQEQVSPEEFNRVCGDLQYLDKHQRDDTAIRYEEKLEKFLSAVLIGDETAEAIRAGFSARLFLSYRKKDRKHARELMGLVHRNEFFRDVAVWYDEFLTPGENFNDSIEDALKSSGLFLLAVTPNLVNEQNYVMTTEYPMAKAAGKPILPAELVKTDREKLNESYPGIPQCTDPWDGDALSRALLTALPELKTKMPLSPEQDFLLGLAYLGGVDVEVDHRRALTLISDAAERGVPEAAEKLAEMYEKGMGVARSYPTAVSWRERCVRLAEKAYRADDSSFPGMLYLCNQAADCGKGFQILGNTEKAEEYYLLANRTVKEYKYFLDYLSDCMKLLILSLDRLAQFRLDQGDLDGAENYFSEALRIREDHPAESGGQPEAVAFEYLKLGEIENKTLRFSRAKTYYEKAADLLRNRDSALSRQVLADCYTHLGLYYRDTEDSPAKAEESLKNAQAIYLRLAEETPDRTSLQDAAAGYRNLGSVQDSPEEALRYYGKALRLAEDLIRDYGRPEDFALKANLLILAGKSFLQENGFDTGLSYLLRAERELLALPPTYRTQTELIQLYDTLGVTANRQEDRYRAMEYFQKQLELCTELQDRDDPSLDYYTYLAYYNLGALYQQMENAPAALGYFRQAIPILSILVDGSEQYDAGLGRDLGNLLQCAGELSEDVNDPSGAREYYRECVDVRARLFQETKDADDAEALGFAYYKIAAVSPADRTACLAAAIQIYEALCALDPQNEAWHSYLNQLRRM